MTSAYRENAPKTIHYVVIFFCNGSMHPEFDEKKLVKHLQGNRWKQLTSNVSRWKIFEEYSYEIITEKSHVSFLANIKEFSDNSPSVYFVRTFEVVGMGFYEKSNNSSWKFSNVS